MARAFAAAAPSSAASTSRRGIGATLDAGGVAAFDAALAEWREAEAPPPAFTVRHRIDAHVLQLAAPAATLPPAQERFRPARPTDALDTGDFP